MKENIYSMGSIIWPEEYKPGTTENFASNEVIVPGLSVEDIWPLLNIPAAWPTYYSNSSDIHFYEGFGPELSMGARFRFNTFGFVVEAQVTEYVPAANGKPARVAWHGWSGSTPEDRLDVIHAWLLEDLPGGRVRILTQESQSGKPAKDLANTKPNPMINGHQDWLNGLVAAATKKAERAAAIIWPEEYVPGTTDNFASNEIIVSGLTVADVWPLLNTPAAWPTYYSNSSDIHFYEGFGPELSNNARFRFNTFGFVVEAEVTEHEPAANGKPARVAWHGWSGSTPEDRLDVIHAWLLEDLPGGRVRILTQESQIGKPAKDLATTTPNPMINGHQDWLDGLAAAAKKTK